MANEWVGVVNTIAPKYYKGEQDLTMRQRYLLRFLERRGKVTFGHASHTCIWTVEYDEIPVESYPDGGVLDFSRHDVDKPASLDWRGYKATDAMTEKEKDMYGDDVGIVNRYKQILPRINKAIRNLLGTEFYIDGNAAGNENRLHGVASFTGEGTVGGADLIAMPSDTFAGISTTLGQYGTWSTALTTSPNSTLDTDWPEGSGSAGYDYWSPLLVNTSSTSWVGAGKTTWTETCEACLRRVIQWLSLLTNSEANTLIGILAGNLFSQFKDAMSAKGLILYPHKESEDLGFGNTLNFEGLALRADYGVPASTGNVFSIEQMEFKSLKKQLIATSGPDWDPRTASWLFQGGMFANIQWNSPKFFAELKARA